MTQIKHHNSFTYYSKYNYSKYKLNQQNTKKLSAVDSRHSIQQDVDL